MNLFAHPTFWSHSRFMNVCRSCAARIAFSVVLSSSMVASSAIAWADSPTPGTIIENQAVGSFLDPVDITPQLIESNFVDKQVMATNDEGLASDEEEEIETVNEGRDRNSAVDQEKDYKSNLFRKSKFHGSMLWLTK